MRDKNFYREIAKLMLEEIDFDNQLEQPRMRTEGFVETLAKQLEDRDLVNEFPSITELSELINGTEEVEGQGFACQCYVEIDATLQKYFNEAICECEICKGGKVTEGHYNQ